MPAPSITTTIRALIAPAHPHERTVEQVMACDRCRAILANARVRLRALDRRP